ncbi:MAG: NAD(P)-dependent oxidoreductase, partial [Acidobacteria bacterium]|nr:NAD(P)-dependent oxidoreductase [Acidobacteriota bacterium]
ALCSALISAGHDVVALRRTDLDIRCAKEVKRVMARLLPDAIINCTAYNAVDAAEADPATAFAVNAHGPALLADVAEASGATLVHYSTDFVFDGTAQEPYTEIDSTNPPTVSPSYVPDVARATIALLENQAPFGTYHCVNSGFSSWYELAQDLGNALQVDGRIEKMLSADLETPATRPRFCALSNEKLRSVGIQMPEWQSAIRRHLATMHEAQVRAQAIA